MILRPPTLETLAGEALSRRRDTLLAELNDAPERVAELQPSIDAQNAEIDALSPPLSALGQGACHL